MYVPLNFENDLTIDAHVDSRAFASALAQSEMDRIKQQASASIFEVDDPPKFQIQVANYQLEKPVRTAALKFDIADHTSAEYFLVMRNLTEPIIGLHYMGHKSVINGTTHGLIFFPHLAMRVKSSVSKLSAKPQIVLFLIV